MESQNLLNLKIKVQINVCTCPNAFVNRSKCLSRSINGTQTYLVSSGKWLQIWGIVYTAGFRGYSLAPLWPAKSAAWRSGLEHRFYDEHDGKVNGSTPNLVSLLRPWIRCFTMIISAWWNVASSKLKKSEENSTVKLGNKDNS